MTNKKEPVVNTAHPCLFSSLMLRVCALVVAVERWIIKLQCLELIDKNNLLTSLCPSK